MRAWIAVANQDVTKAQHVQQRMHDDEMRRQGMPVHDIVTDLSAPETQCPACLTKFVPDGTGRCPECGLNFA